MYFSTSLSPFGQLLFAKDSKKNAVTGIPAQTLVQLVETHKVVVLRGFQPLPQSDFESFAQTLGSLLRWEFGAVLNLRVDKTSANHLFNSGRVELHWDGVVRPENSRHFLW